MALKKRNERRPREQREIQQPNFTSLATSPFPNLCSPALPQLPWPVAPPLPPLLSPCQIGLLVPRDRGPASLPSSALGSLTRDQEAG